jgi:hypothetical protein
MRDKTRRGATTDARDRASTKNAASIANPFPEFGHRNMRAFASPTPPDLSRNLGPIDCNRGYYLALSVRDKTREGGLVAILENACSPGRQFFSETWICEKD